MYTGTYAPWENMPKLLRHDEMMHPLRVVTDFFEIDNVEGHGARFKEWRDYAVKEPCYENEKHGPSLLLYTWEEHVRLMEAMYLLWHEYRNESWQYKKASEEQLAQEKATWDYYPTKLNADQLASPHLVTEKFFKDMGLAVYRDHLYDWLVMALSKAVYRDPDLDAEAVITVYENMLELHEAAWIICQRNGERPHLISKANKEPEPAPAEPAASEPLEHLNVADQVREHTDDRNELLKPLYPKPSPACALGLQKVKEDMLAHYPTVQLIVYLGSHADPFTCYLLLLVSDEEKREEGHLSTNIEDHLQPLVHTHIILHKAVSAIAALHKGSRFWNDALSQGEVIYRSDDLPTFETQLISNQVRLERAQFHWNLWGKQGEELLQGAAFFHESGNHRQAAFLLHKATETTLKGIIQAVLGYRIQMHNICRLLQLTLLFTDSLKAVFELNSEAGVQEFTFLKTAYAQAHYSDSFAPDGAIIKALLGKVRQLHEQAQAVYEVHLQRLHTEQ
jgi:HEPN domain-containing protein